ncbi:MAG: methyltransferase domain-containing protein [Salinivenus sp.]
MSYAVDESNLRRQELLAEVFRPSTEALLGDLSVSKGADVLDVGCGIGRTTRLLGNLIPDPGRVVGLDADPDLLEVARDRSDADGHDLTYQEGDAAALPYEEGAFDLIFARFLLAHLPEPAEAVDELRRVCRDGGVVAVQEPDFASTGAWPPSPAMDRAQELGEVLFDTKMGRKTWTLFREAGLNTPAVRAVVPVETGEDNSIRRLYTLSVQAIGGALLEKGHLEKPEYEALVEDARRLEDDPDRLAAIYTVYSVWGNA